MTLQERFESLSVDKKLQLAYYAAEQNKDLLLEWLDTDFVEYGSMGGDPKEILSDNLAFLKKLIFPKFQANKVEENEDEFSGRTESINMLREWMGDNTESEKIDVAFASILAMQTLFYFIGNYVFEHEGEFYDDELIPVLQYAFLPVSELDDDLIKEHLDNVSESTDWTTWETMIVEDQAEETFRTFLNSLFSKV